ncbi:hypothetical protein [Streptomyces sp. AK02-01A]|uniref:hypothetical protein n=1 Tax=Streptomyces sp. AK02-01A TaxID=3028648 RepID=UPI0029B26CE5|nr:hypothetical protein [Streptomyces sp. AK02-01A]MDX3852644.1 hypothetical protein [Streptomyces sp. AK02-01A]
MLEGIPGLLPRDMMNSRSVDACWSSAGFRVRHDRPEMLDTSQGEPSAPTDEQRGCLFALSQPPLMIFLTVIGALLLMAAVHDLFLL